MRVWAALMAMGLAGPAAALSCMPRDAAAAFQTADEAAESYVILRGTLSFAPGAIDPQGSYIEPGTAPYPQPFAATFEGQQMLGDGRFSDQLSLPLTVEPLCFGPWCPGLRTGAEVIGFVRQDADGALTFEVDACESRFAYLPAEEYVATLASCISGGDCTPGN